MSTILESPVQRFNLFSATKPYRCFNINYNKQSKISSQKIKGVIFDFDGVLANFETRFIWPFLSALRSFGLKFTSKEMITSLQEFDAMIMEENLSAWKITKALSKLAQKLGLNPFQTASFLVRFGLYYNNNPYKIIPIVGAREVLRDIRKNGYKIILITNSQRKTIEKAKEIFPELDDFDLIITKSDVKNPKPNPEGFRKALRTLELESHEVISIGDQASDIVVASKMNIFHIAIASYYSDYLIPYLSEYEPDLIIEELSDVLEFLSQRREQEVTEQKDCNLQELDSKEKILFPSMIYDPFCSSATKIG